MDWNKVNSRHIANVPAPTPQPVYGCSSDPAFYQDRYHSYLLSAERTDAPLPESAMRPEVKILSEW